MAEKLNIHHVILAALVALSGSLTWLTASGAFSASSVFSSTGAVGLFYAIIQPIAAFAVFLATLSVASMSSVPSFFLLAAIIAVSSASILVLKSGSLIMAAGFFASMLLYSNSVRAESSERIRAAPSKCTAAGYGGALFIFVVALSLAVYFGAQKSATGFLIPNAALEVAIAPVLSAMGCDRQATMDVCADALADKQLAAMQEQISAKCGGDSACIALVERQLASGKAELVGEAKAGLAKQLGVDANSTETLSAILARTAKEKLDKILEPYKGLIAPLSAIMAFTTLTTISALMRPMVLLLSAILFMAFKAAGLIEVRRESREVDIIR